MYFRKFALSVFAASHVCLAAPAGSHDAVYDAVVIGGGFSGLSAAKDLVAANKTVLVLEARDRVGGRVLNKKTANGYLQEMGAEFVGPTQDRVIALIAELGLSTYLTYNKGSNVLHFNNTIKKYSAAGSIPPLALADLLQLGSAASHIDSMAKQIDVRTPWTHPKAQEWDSITLYTWVNNFTKSEPVRKTLEVACTAVFSTEPRELSFLYFLSYIASAGNETQAGTIERLIGTGSGAQERRITGGTQLIAIKLAERLGKSRVVLGKPVRRIVKRQGSYKVVADGLTVRAKQVVVAMSPPLASRIIYDPLLPAQRDQLSQRMPMGSLGKIIAIYDKPFWRDNGLSGQALSDTGVVRTTFDNSPDNATYGAMMGFIEADEMRLYDDTSEEHIFADVTKDFVNYFGPKAANVSSWVLQRWDNTEFSRGGPVAYGPPGVLTQFGSALRAPFHGIHFAGTESAWYWTGYMDGAIRSGERAAQEVLTALNAEHGHEDI